VLLFALPFFIAFPFGGMYTSLGKVPEPLVPTSEGEYRTH